MKPVSRFSPKLALCSLVLVSYGGTNENMLSTSFAFGGDPHIFVDSVHGDDDSGKGTLDKPWKAVAMVNRSVPAGSYIVKFSRGSVFDGTDERLEPKSGNTYTAYGAGEKPEFRSCITTTNASWTAESQNIWRHSNPSLVYADVGFVVVDQTIHEAKKWEKDALSSNWEFFSEKIVRNRYELYLYYEGDPNSKEIIVGLHRDAIHMPRESKDITIDNLKVRYTAWSGIEIESGKNIIIKNSDISYCGGGFGGNRPRTRNGQGINTRYSVEDIYIYDNTITHCYDAAIAMQGYTDGDHRINIQIYGNLIEKCQFGIQFIQRHDTEATKDLTISGNTINDIGLGWGSTPEEARPGRNAASIQSAFMEGQYERIKIVNNKFNNSAQHFYRMGVYSGATANHHEAFTIDYNVYKQKGSNLFSKIKKKDNSGKVKETLYTPQGIESYLAYFNGPRWRWETHSIFHGLSTQSENQQCR